MFSPENTFAPKVFSTKNTFRIKVFSRENTFRAQRYTKVLELPNYPPYILHFTDHILPAYTPRTTSLFVFPEIRGSGTAYICQMGSCRQFEVNPIIAGFMD